jgi:hypothetical protein
MDTPRGTGSGDGISERAFGSWAFLLVALGVALLYVLSRVSY